MSYLYAHHSAPTKKRPKNGPETGTKNVRGRVHTVAMNNPGPRTVAHRRAPSRPVPQGWPAGVYRPNVRLAAETVAWQEHDLAMSVSSRSPMHRISLTLAFALTASLGATGCVEEDQSGTLTINYRFGGLSNSCADEAVEEVRVSLDGTEFAEEPCDESEGITLPSVPAKPYGSLLVEGIDAEGVTIRDNLDAPHDDESVEVLGGAAQSKDVQLSPTPALLRFRFIVLDEDGAPYPPAATIPIKSFDVNAYEDGGNSLLLSHQFVYAQLQSTTVDTPDPDRDLNGEDLDAITVDIVDQQNASVEELQWEITPPGAGRLVLVEINCRGTTCEGEPEVMGAAPVDPTGGTGTGGDTDGDGTGTSG